MSGQVLIVRPGPGAARTAARALALGLEPVVAPLFRITRLARTPPPATGFDAVLITSANAPRHAGERLSAFLALPCFAVGDVSADAARAAGFRDVRIGPADGPALAQMAAASGFRKALHPCGRHRRPIEAAGLGIVPFPVYASEKVETLPVAAAEAVAEGAVVLLHSSRAAAHFAALFDGARRNVRLAAISPAVAVAAGPGWADIAVAMQPRDPALLAVAAELCQNAGR